MKCIVEGGQLCASLRWQEMARVVRQEGLFMSRFPLFLCIL